MKRTFIALLCFLLAANLTHARFLSIGPRIGTHIFRYKGNYVINNTESASLQMEDHWGYHVGAFTRFDLFLFYVQPEILLTRSGAKFSKHNKALKIGFTKLDMPAMVGLSLLGVVRAQLGPVFSLLLSAKEGDEDVKEYYSNITIGGQAGLGVDIWKIAIDLKYARSLSRFGNAIAGVRTNHKYALWSLSIGVNIL